eukprot:scaffold3346_cov313-Pinguiococcus_pyrenoidosus.AAC.7
MLWPPVPVPVGSPVWTMKPGITRWNRVSSYARSRQSCTKLRQAKGASRENSSTSTSPNVVCSTTFPAVGGSFTYTDDISASHNPVAFQMPLETPEKKRAKSCGFSTSSNYFKNYFNNFLTIGIVTSLRNS